MYVNNFHTYVEIPFVYHRFSNNGSFQFFYVYGINSDGTKNPIFINLKLYYFVSLID